MGQGKFKTVKFDARFGVEFSHMEFQETEPAFVILVHVRSKNCSGYQRDLNFNWCMQMGQNDAVFPDVY